jgi:hypothetical protein
MLTGRSLATFGRILVGCAGNRPLVPADTGRLLMLRLASVRCNRRVGFFVPRRNLCGKIRSRHRAHLSIEVIVTFAAKASQTNGPAPIQYARIRCGSRTLESMRAAGMPLKKLLRGSLMVRMGELWCGSMPRRRKLGRKKLQLRMPSRRFNAPKKCNSAKRGHHRAPLNDRNTILFCPAKNLRSGRKHKEKATGHRQTDQFQLIAQSKKLGEKNLFYRSIKHRKGHLRICLSIDATINIPSRSRSRPWTMQTPLRD